MADSSQDNVVSIFGAILWLMMEIVAQVIECNLGNFVMASQGLDLSLTAPAI